MSVSARHTTGLADLKVGEVVHGTVRKVETFGVFVTVDGCAASGLCHISEVADERIKSLPARVSVGERVKAVVLRVDPEVRCARFLHAVWRTPSFGLVCCQRCLRT